MQGLSAGLHETPDRRKLALDVRQLLADPPIPNAEDVDAADVTGRAVPNPGVAPADDASVTGREHLLDVEVRLRRAAEECLPCRANGDAAHEPLSIGRRPRVLEHAVVSDQPHER